MASRQESIVHIPDDSVIEILARVGSFSSKDLDSMKCSCRELRRISEDPEVYRRARMTDNHIVAIFNDHARRLSASEVRFIAKCVDSRNPFKAYARAVYNLVEKGDVEATLHHLDEATGSDTVTDPAAYLKCVALLYSSGADHNSAGLQLLSTLKSSGKFEECRRRFNLLLTEMRWNGYIGMLDCKRTAPLCPNRGEESDDCLLCDAERWMQNYK